jgi:hypothetical protein
MAWKGWKTNSLLQHELVADVAVGSITSIFACPRHVRFTPDSDRTADIAGGPQSATRRHCSVIRSPRRRPLFWGVSDGALEVGVVDQHSVRALGFPVRKGWSDCRADAATKKRIENLPENFCR